MAKRVKWCVLTCYLKDSAAVSSSDNNILCFSPVAVPGVSIKVTFKSHARVPDVVSSTFTLNILPSITLVMIWRETVASVEKG